MGKNVSAMVLVAAQGSLIISMFLGESSLVKMQGANGTLNCFMLHWIRSDFMDKPGDSKGFGP